MKKIKELVCFLIAIAILWLLPLAGILLVDLLADAPAFVGPHNYIKLFLNDPILSPHCSIPTCCCCYLVRFLSPCFL